MKRLIYIAYLGLLALILISCQKEAVTPDGALAGSADDQARTLACKPYSYLTKTGTFHLGNLRTDYMLVGFNSNITQVQQQQILSQYSIYDQIESDYLADANIVVAVVKLNSNATCLAVELMMNSLERKRQVRFANPIFNDPNMVLAWIGETDEMLVTLKSAAYYPHLQQLTRITRTTILYNLFDQIYIVSADKNSAGDALQMSSLFNASPFIEIAEPNFLMQAPPLKTGAKPEIKMSKDLLQEQAL